MKTKLLLILVLILTTVPVLAQDSDIKINGHQLKAYLCARGLLPANQCKAPPKKCQWKPCGK